MASSTNPAKQSLLKEQKEQHRAERSEGRDAGLTHALEDTFPASDPVAAESATTAGAAPHPQKRPRPGRT